MGAVHKIGEDYYIEFYARGLKYQQRAGPSRADAERRLKEIEEKIVRGEAALIVRDVDLDIFLKDFLEYARTQHLRQTFKRYLALVSHFQEFVRRNHPALRKLSGMTPSVLEGYRVSLIRSFADKKNNTRLVNLSLILLEDIFEYSLKLIQTS